MAHDEYSENCINHLVFKRIKPQTHWRKVPSMSSRGGRGRGNGRGGGRNNVTRGPNHPRSAPTTPIKPRSINHQQSRRAQSATRPNINPSMPKKDGEKGASSHTVSESHRIQLDTLLLNLRESETETMVTMPADLTNTQRKYVHELAKKLGLKSKSYGKGEERKVVVSKVDESKGGGISGEDQNIPVIDIGVKGEEALKRHLQKFPPNDVERMESIETGSSLLKQRKEESQGLDLMQEAINALPTIASEQNVYDTTNSKTAKHQQMVKRRVQNHVRAQKAMKSHPNYKKMMVQRKNLPAFSYAQDVCNVLMEKKNQVIILTGDTGCGKSTQVPQFLLDDPQIGPTANILITQPRRISAISVAERVASERCESAGQSVGFSVRLETSVSDCTQLLFVTPGVLMRRLNPENGEDSGRLAEFTHIIMDEIHERDKNTEFLMIALQDILEQRDDLQLILMSATMPTRDLAEYWCGVGRRRLLRRKEQQLMEKKSSMTEHTNSENIAPTSSLDDDWGDDAAVLPTEINIPGRTFPVQSFFLEDVLTMTGFVDDVEGAETADMAQIENDLMSLLINKTEGATKSSESNKKARNNTKSVAPVSRSMLENTLTCVICNQRGFKCAEEFGTHVALCDGGGKSSMEELEHRVRAVDASSITGFDSTITNVTTTQDLDTFNDTDVDMFDIPEEDFEDYDDDAEPEVWSGDSPFIVDNVGTSNKPSLTEEEMLTRYHTMYDDEEINYDLILELVRYVVKSSYGDGAILIFFPGWAEISEFSLILESTPPFSDSSQFITLPLHSGIPSKDQRQVFQKPPIGTRKVILATNIAETSLTIEDVAFVIDTGRAKEKSYDPHLKTSTLQESWISQASAKQRRGRAGRCKAGVCFHLFSKRRHASMRPFVESELIRTPLEEICLQCKRLNLAPGGPEDPTGIPMFLSKAMTPPHPKSILNALELLVDLGAMDEETNDLTDLGWCLSALSLEPRVGKMVIMSNMLGCTKSATAMATAMSYKSPFALPPQSMRKMADMAKIRLSNGSESDQITALNVVRQRDILLRRGNIYGWCKENFINFSAINMISDLRKNASRELESLGFPSSSVNGFHNRNEDYPHLAFHQAAICAGLYPNIAYRRCGDVNFSTMSDKKAKVHLSSVNAVKPQPLSIKCAVTENEIEFIMFGELVKGKAMFTMDNTSHLVSSLPLILFCGHLKVRPVEEGQAILSVDDWLMFLCNSTIAASLVVLRQRLDSIFASMTSDPSNYHAMLSSEQRDAIQTLDHVIKFAFQKSQKGQARSKK